MGNWFGKDGKKPQAQGNIAVTHIDEPSWITLVQRVANLSASAAEVAKASTGAGRVHDEMAVNVAKAAEGAAEQTRLIHDSLQVMQQFAKSVDQISEGVQRQTVIGGTGQPGGAGHGRPHPPSHNGYQAGCHCRNIGRHPGY